jgi:hypothetical protein
VTSDWQVELVQLVLLNLKLITLSRPFHVTRAYAVWLPTVTLTVHHFLSTMFRFSRSTYQRFSRLKQPAASYVIAVGASGTLVYLASLAAGRRIIRCDDSLDLNSERDEDAREAFPGAFRKPKWSTQDYLSANSIFEFGPIWYASEELGISRCDALSVVSLVTSFFMIFITDYPVEIPNLKTPSSSYLVVQKREKILEVTLVFLMVTMVLLPVISSATIWCNFYRKHWLDFLISAITPGTSTYLQMHWTLSLILSMT